MPGVPSTSTYQGYNSQIYSQRLTDTHTHRWLHFRRHACVLLKMAFSPQQQTLPEARQGEFISGVMEAEKRWKIRSPNPFQTFNRMTQLQRGSKGRQVGRGGIFDLRHPHGHFVMLTFKHKERQEAQMISVLVL